MERFFVVQISPTRWVVVEKVDATGVYKVCTKKLTRQTDAATVCGELNTCDTRDYSKITMDALFEGEWS